MNILVTINKNYLRQLLILLKSLQKSNDNVLFDVFVMAKDITDLDIKNIQENLSKKITIHLINIPDSEIDNFPVVEKRYPIEIYFRLFATKYLPEDIDKILYLDTDIVVINSLQKLYDMDFLDNYFITTTHVRKFIHKFHEVRLNMNNSNVYVNTGVLLMNLKALRKTNIERDVINFVDKNKYKLMLPDQDILSALYGDKVMLVDALIYNLGERGYNLYNLNNKNKIDLNWLRKNSVIIHYYGRNKPWGKNYRGELNVFYNEIVDEMEVIHKNV